MLYLDEPTIGLDVAVKARFREFIRYMHHERGLTVMLTSHDLGDIEELCDRMIIYDGAVAEVNERCGWERQIHLTLSDPIEDAVARASTVLDGRDGIQPLPPRIPPAS